MVSPREEEDRGQSTITGLSYKRIEDYTKDLDRSKAISDLNDEIQTDRYGFIIHEANENVQSKEMHLPFEIVQKRELKWLSMMKNWEAYMKSKARKEKIKERCRKGIPSAIRGKAWQLLTGSTKNGEKEPDIYMILSEKESPEYEHIIWKDVKRTFPYHELFIEDKGPGQNSLFRVLKAYSLYNPEVGYSQALSPIVAVLLMHMTEEESFWVLASICDNYLKGYFGKKLESVQLDCIIFSSLLKQTYPYISNHFIKHGIDPAMYIIEWMMCIFSRTLPFATALRVWDIFFCEGVKILFRTGLSLLKLAFPSEKSLLLHDDDCKTIQRVKNVGREELHETVLIPLALNLKLTKNDLKKLHVDALSKRPDLALTKS